MSRTCQDCQADISHRAARAARCEPCAAKRNKDLAAARARKSYSRRAAEPQPKKQPLSRSEIASRYYQRNKGKPEFKSRRAAYRKRWLDANPDKRAAYRAAQTAARTAAQEAARTAAQEAARTAAQEAARTAAQEAARTAAQEAARTAAQEAARTAAQEAARTAAQEAARTAAQGPVGDCGGAGNLV